MITTFTETMRGSISPTPEGAGRALQGGPLVFHDLVLELTHPQVREHGFAGPIVSGGVTGPGLDGELVCGDAHILYRNASGTRDMLYRLIVVDQLSGRHFRIDGVKSADGSLRRAWQQTTTLQVNIIELGVSLSSHSPHTHQDLLDTPLGSPHWSGVCHVLVRDLIPQILSIRGAALRFAATFAFLLLR